MSTAIKQQPPAAASGAPKPKQRAKRGEGQKDRNLKTASVNFHRGVLRSIKRDVRKSKGQFRSVSAWVNFHAAKITGTNI
jgi:hypothetical protein